MIKPRIPALLLGALVLASCGKENAPETGGTPATPAAAEVPAGGVALTASKPSPHFLQVMSHLDVGGKVLHYNDHEGRRELWTQIAEFALEAARESGGVKLPTIFSAAALVDDVGLLNVAASGRSISADGDGWLMKQFSLFEKGKPQLAYLMGKAQPFVVGTRLSAATDIAFEMRVNGSSLPATMRRTAKLFGSAEEIEAGLAEELPFGMTVEKMLGLSRAHLLVGIELTETGEAEMPVIPKDWVMELTTDKQLMAALQPMMKGVLGESTDIGGRQGWSLEEMVPPMPGVGQPVLVMDGEERLRIASSAAYLAQLDGETPKLSGNSIYQAATNHFPTAGNLQLYLSPEVPAGISKWMDTVASREEDAEMVAEVVRKLTPDKPWSVCVSIDEDGMHTRAEMPFAIDADSTVMMVALGSTSTLFVGARAWKRGSDRSAVIMNIRNCQQAMRGHQNMHDLKTGDPFTRKDLEEYMNFPEDIKVSGGWIRFEAGDSITPVGELWLKVTGPGMNGAIGDYGFEDASAYENW